MEKADEKQENGIDHDDNDNQKKSEEPLENEQMTPDQGTNDDFNSKETTDPVMEIEGVVHGEADNNVVQSASRLTAVDDEDNKV